MRRQAGLISNLVESRFCHVLGHTLGHGLVRPVHKTVKARAEYPTRREKKSLANTSELCDIVAPLTNLFFKKIASSRMQRHSPTQS